MKVLFLANAVSTHTVRWVNTLASRGHEVHLVFNNEDSPQDNQISSSVKMYKLRYSGSKAYYLNALELKKIFNKIKPNIVNAHYASGYGTLARIARLKPLVLSVWGSDVYDFPYQSKFKMKIIRQNLLYAEQIVSTSNSMANQVKKLLNLKSIHIEITPFGVDVEKFSRSVKYKSKEKINIGNIKSLNPKYGIPDLVKSIRLLKDNLEKNGRKSISNNIKVYIYGDGKQRNEIIKLIKNLDLESTVELKGKILNSEVPIALEQLDIFCGTSIRESFGVSVVEAMAMEIPVVATDTDGFLEVVNNGNTGLIVKTGNPLEISKALEKLILDENLRVKMGEKGRARVLELYDWEKNVDKMVDLYYRISNNIPKI